MTTRTSTQSTPDVSASLTHVVLVPGYWLGAWAWEAVETRLFESGLVPHAITLPGLDDASSKAVTLQDQIAAVAELVETLSGEIVLVGHSGGAVVVQGVLDRKPERISRVIYVDSGPLCSGVSLHPDATADVSLPSWSDLQAEGSSIDGISEADLERFELLAVAHPVGVANAAVQLSNERRHDVPASVISTSFPSTMLRELIRAGQIPSELLEVNDVRFIDLPTSHWPMFSRPKELAEIISEEVSRSCSSH